MSKLLLYTFRSVEYKDQFDYRVFAFNKLNEDIEKFFALLKAEEVDHVVGVGNGPFTRFESRAVNSFHTKRILQEGPGSYDLFIPRASIPAGIRPTESFCNWTAYRIAHFISENKVNIRQSFLHVRKKEPRETIADLINSF